MTLTVKFKASTLINSYFNIALFSKTYNVQTTANQGNQNANGHNNITLTTTEY